MSFREVGVWRCEVVDDGAGISTNDQRKVFGEFVQFRKNELQAGGFINISTSSIDIMSMALKGDLVSVCGYRVASSLCIRS